MTSCLFIMELSNSRGPDPSWARDPFLLLRLSFASLPSSLENQKHDAETCPDEQHICFNESSKSYLGYPYARKLCIAPLKSIFIGHTKCVPGSWCHTEPSFREPTISSSLHPYSQSVSLIMGLALVLSLIHDTVLSSFYSGWWNESRQTDNTRQDK